MIGRCLCGTIEFTAQDIPGWVFNCHCSRCRVLHGADYATLAIAVRSSLRFTRGLENLSEYASTGNIRAFCSLCGSRLMNYAKDDADYLSIAIACLDDSYRGRAVAHCFTASKAAWHTPDSGIPSFEGLPSSAAGR